MSTTSTSLRAAASAADEQQQTLAMLLRALKLPAFAVHHEELARLAEQEGWTCPHYLRQLVELELSERRGRRVERLLKASGLPADKTLATLEQEKLCWRSRGNAGIWTGAAQVFRGSAAPA